MSLPTLGELRFAESLFASERKARRRSSDQLWNRFFDMAVMVTFVFFLFM